MTRPILSVLALAVLVACGGCGKRVELTRKPGMVPPPVPYGAVRPETPQELVRPSAQSRPQRNGDLVWRSEPRTDDYFNIPPGPDNGQ